MFGFLAHARDNGFGEFFGADLLFAHAFFEDVVSMNAFFKGAQPGIVNKLGHVGLADVVEHQNATKEEAGGIS